MKIAVSSTDTGKSSKVEQRFGRSKWFLVYNTETQEWKVLENSLQMDSSHGAGIQTAQMIAREGINAVITGHCGPNAWKVLSSANIPVYFVGSRTVEEAVNELLSGNLVPTEDADVGGHW